MGYYDDMRQLYAQAQSQKEAKRKAGWLDTAGGVVGAGVGMALGGPGGAMAGYNAGSALGGVGENAVNHTLTPQNVVSDAAGAFTGGQGVQDAAQQQSLMDALKQLQGGMMGFSSGGVVPSPEMLAMLQQAQQPDDPFANATPQDIAGPPPKMQPMQKVSHPGLEAVSAILGDIIGKLPGPANPKNTKAIGAWAPAIGAAVSGPGKYAAAQRAPKDKLAMEENKAATEGYRRDLSQAARDLANQRHTLTRQKAMALFSDTPKDPAAKDAPLTPAEAKQMGHPEWAGMKREDVRLSLSGRDQRSGEVTPASRASFINTLGDNMRQDQDIKDFGVVRDNYRRVEKMVKMGVGVGDLAVIFSYMKVLDPTSVVRETEFKNAAEAVGQFQRIANIPAWVVSGNRLTPEGREWFKKASWELFQAKRKDFANAVESYAAQGREYGIDPSLVVNRYKKYLNDEFMGGDPTKQATGETMAQKLAKQLGGQAR